jgi:hypothetical protein
MPPGRIGASRARAARTTVALAAISASLGAVAYAAVRVERPASGLAAGKPAGIAPERGAPGPRGGVEEAVLRPRLLEYPEAISAVAEPQFRFHVPPRPQRSRPAAPQPASEPSPPPRRFQCQLDGSGWSGCNSPYRLSSLAPGGHAFAVRAFNRAGRPGPATSYSWRQAQPAPVSARADDPKPFSIELERELEDLYPGYPPQQLPILVTNPNPVAIEVTGLGVAIAGEPAGCSAENFVLTPSSISPQAPLTVPAGASVSLPTATASAPAIGMLNLAVDQDPCQGIELPLRFEGEAHG